MMNPIDWNALAQMLRMGLNPSVTPVASIPKKPGFQNPTEGAMPMRGGGGGSGRARIGGERGVNGYEYKGGQFLPSTDAPPGTFRVGRGVVKAKQYEVEPGKREVQATPTARSVYHEAAPGFYTRLNADRSGLELNPGAGGGGVRDYHGNPVTLQTKIGNRTLGDLIDLYNRGVRWIDD